MTRVSGECINITDLTEALGKSKLLWKNLIFMKL